MCRYQGYHLMDPHSNSYHSNTLSHHDSTASLDRQYGGNREGGDSSTNTSSSGGGDYSQLLDNEEGWDLEFVPQRSEKHDCPICLLVLREPMQTECGHRFCKACILKWLRESECRCPVDNQPLEETQLFPDNFAKREILALTVKCPNHKKGCDRIVVLKHVQEHIDECTYSLTPCPNQCSHILLRGDIASHLHTQCPKRNVSCQQCSAEVQADRMKDHSLICPLSVTACPNCSVQVTRHSLSDHIGTECVRANINCQYRFLGCEFTAERQHMSDHDNSSVQNHMLLINRALQLLFSVLNLSPATVNRTVGNTSSLGFPPTEMSVPSEGSSVIGLSGAISYPSVLGPGNAGNLSLLQNLMSRFNLVPADMNVNPNMGHSSSMGQVRTAGSLALSGANTRNSNSMPLPHGHEIPSMSLSPQVGNPQGHVVHPPGQTFSGGSNVTVSTSSNQTGMAKLSFTSEPLERRDDNEMPQNLTSVADSQFRSFKCQNDLQDESLARHNQQLLELCHQNEFQEKLIRDLKVKVKTLENTVSDFEGRNGNGTYIWKIKNYVKLRRDAEKGDTTAIHSQSFYSSFYGYKLCIRVNLNGVDSARGTHLSLFIHFMQGDYDEILEWPFNGRIVLTIIDQNPICEMRNPISETLMSKPNLAAFQRPVSSRNHKGFGYMEFIPLQHIDGSTYVRNDTLIIKANIIASTT